MATTEPPAPFGLSRSRTLTNSAAEFLELRGDETMGTELADLSSEFVPELDHFLPRDEILQQEYFVESQERVEKFKETLALFQKNLIDRKVDRRYEIDIKDANSYTLHDVLQIARIVQKKHSDADQVHSCMGRLKKFFHATGRNASTFKRLLTFVPDDVYGSVICGGFTVILGTLERLETLRTDMYTALDKIPVTLSRLHDLLDVNYQSSKLKQYGDGVLVAIFVLLELIVRELSGSSAKKIFKAPFRGGRYGHTIDEATKSLQDAVKDFETEARICDSQRLGRVDLVTRRTLLTAAHIATETKRTGQGVTQLSHDFIDFTSQQKDLAEQLRADQAAGSQKVLDQLRQTQIDLQRHSAQVLQEFYHFLAANSAFDPKTGTLDQYQAQQRSIQELSPSSSFGAEEDSPTEPVPFSDTEKALVNSWSKVSGNAQQITEKDLRQSIGEITAKENDTAENTRAMHDRIGYILTSSQLSTWLSAAESSLLVIQSNAEVVEEQTTSSYSSALLVSVIQKIKQFPVLWYFSASRAAVPYDGELRGAAGLYISLITQLLNYLRDRNTHVELQFLERVIRHLKRGERKVRQLRRTFQELIDQLPVGAGLFIVVDSIYKLQEADGDEEVQELLKLVRNDERHIKLFVTDALSPRIIEPMTAWMKKTQRRAEKKATTPSMNRVCLLEVPEDVDGYHTEFNVSWIKEELQGSVEKANSSQSASSTGNEEE